MERAFTLRALALVTLGVAACGGPSDSPDAAVADMDGGARDAAALEDAPVDGGRTVPDAPLDAVVVPDAAELGDAPEISDAPIDAPTPTDAPAASDAFAPADAPALADAFAPPDAFRVADAFVAADAFRATDAFVPTDAFRVADAFVPPDAFRGFPTCSAPDLAVPTPPTPPALVISEIDPGTFIEVYNTTSADIALSSTSYQFCSPFVYAALGSLGAGVVVRARGYASLPWPAGFADTEAGGEISLYTSAAYADPAAVMSFVCWGTNPHGTRKATAESGGRWSGPCAGAITAGRSINRRPGTSGVTAATWAIDAVPSPETCGP